MPVVPGKGPTVADRHNNPLNIKYGSSTKRHVDEGRATLGEKATDGGQFLKFNSAADGFQAGRDLLFGPDYSSRTVEDAMRRWSGGGYGADVGGFDGKRLVATLSPQEQESLIQAMAKREGYAGVNTPSAFAGIVSGSSTTAPLDDSWGTALEAMRRQDMQRLGISLAVQKQAPDAAAEAEQLSKKTGIPVEVVGRNLEQVRLQAQQKDFASFLEGAPKLAGWLKDPQNLAASKDDLPQLGMLEKLVMAGREFLASAHDVFPGVIGFLEVASQIPVGMEGEGLGPVVVDYERIQKEGGLPAPRLLEERRKMAERASEKIRGSQEGLTPFEHAVVSGIGSIGSVISKIPLGPAGMLAAIGAETVGKSATEGKDQGLPPAVALAYGSVDGAIEVGTELLPVGLLFKQLEGGPFLRTLATELATELPGEQAATALQDLNAWAILPENESKTFRDYLNERPGAAAETLIATVVGTLGQAGIARAANRIAGGPPDKALDAQVSKQTMENAVSGLQQSKTFERLPEKVADFVNGLRPDQPAYVPVEAVERYFQTTGEDPSEWSARMTGDREAFSKARLSGEDIAVPWGTLAAEIAANEQAKGFLEEYRESPEAMNAREAGELEAEAAGTENNIPSDSQEFPSDSATRIADDIRGQLLNTGFDDSVVNSYAKLYEQVFGTLGQRAGLDPFELYQKYRLQVVRPLPEILKTLPDADNAIDVLLDRLRTGNLPQQQEMFGQSLLDFLRQKGGIRDEGGELESLEVTRQENEARKPFQKKNPLVREDGLPLDRAREAAAEAGYLPEDSTVADFLDLIEREVRGEPVFSPQFHNEKEVSQGIALEQLGGFLQQMGVDLQVSDNAAVRKLLKPDPNEISVPLDENGGTPLGQNTLGAFTINPKTREALIEFFDKADLSTFLHESGHFFLEVFADVAERLRAQGGELTAEQQQLVADYDAALKHLGVENRGQIQSEQHELFARSFEAYLREGKAPTPELRSVFMRFRDWLVSIYQSLSQLRVKMNPEITGLFDRLIASDAEIQRARDEAKVESLLLNEQVRRDVGMTDDEFVAFGADVKKAGEAESEKLQRQYLNEYQRESEDWYQKEREKVRSQVAAEVHGQRGYIALAFLQKGTLPDGSPLPEGIEGVKLDAAALEQAYGKYKDSSVMKELGKLRVYARENGASPDHVAELLGFSSGDELVQTLRSLRPMNELIDAETDDRMRQTYGDIRTDGTAPEKARDAVMTSGRAKVIEAEMKALARKVRETAPFVRLGRQQERADRKAEAAELKRFIPSLKAVQEIADRRVRDMKARDLRPGTYWAAARRNSKEATEAALAGNYPEALSAKQQELISVEMYRAVTEARAESEKIAKLIRSFDDPKVRQRIGKAAHGYLDQIDALRERFDFTRRTLKQVDELKSLQQFASDLQAANVPVDIPEEFLNERFRKNFKDMTVSELRGLRDSVANLAHLARHENKLLKARQKEETDAVVDKVNTSIAEHAGKKRRVQLEPRHPSGERLRRFGRYLASHEKLPTLLRMMDGFKDGGPLWEYGMRVLNEAADSEAERYADTSKALQDLYTEAFAGEEATLWKKTYIPAIGDSLSKWGRIMVALNWGNLGNRSRLLSDPVRKWNEAQVQSILSTLDERDWDYVQKMWDLIGSFSPEIKAKYKRIHGVEPEMVESAPFVNRFGREMKGGYFPILYEDRLHAGAANNLDAGFAESLKAAAYSNATTRRGHEIARVRSVSQPLRLDYGVVTEHLQQVIHDLTHHEALLDVTKILGDKRVQAQIYDYYGDQAYKEIRAAIRDIALGNGPAPEWYKSIDGFRQGVVIASLGWKATTALLQPFQLTNSIVRLGGGVEGAKWVARGIVSSLRSAKSAEGSVFWIKENSAFMRQRWNTQIREVNEMRNQVGLNSGRIQGKLRDLMHSLGIPPNLMPSFADSYFYMIQKFQQVADVPTWLGAYKKAIAEGNEHERASALADQAVIDAQGSGHIKDLARIERQQGAKLFTTFYSFQNVLLQNQIEAFKRDASVGRKLVDASLLTWVPIVLTTGLFAALKPDDDDEGFLRKVSGDVLGGLLGMFVGAREFSGIFQGYWDYKGPASLRFIPDTYAVAKQVGQGEADAAFWRSLNRAGGDFFHYPADQVQRTAQGFNAMIQGKTSNPAVLIFGPEKKN